MANIAIYDPNAVVPNQIVQYLLSVNTPDYTTNAIINPDLSVVQSLPMKYWVAPDGISIIAMTTQQQNTVDDALLPGIKTTQKQFLFDTATIMADGQGYSSEVKHNMLSMYADSIRIKPNRAAYLQPFIDWMRSVDEEIKTKQAAVDDAMTIEAVQAITIDTATLISADPHKTISGALAITDSSDLSIFLDANAEVTDTDTGLKGPFYIMQELEHRKDLYNDTQNPIYSANRTPILGSSGLLQIVDTRLVNLETIHQKTGWHEEQVEQSLNHRPKDLLIYYSYLNSFNSAVNSWDNEKVAKDMAKYNILVFGDTIESPSHPDYANTLIIIPRIKALNPDALIFGYVATAQLLADFETKVSQWNTLGVHGIFMDEAGYDYGTNRTGFNVCVNYIHSQTSANLCFANAWTTNHILGTVNDPSYPNSTFNPGLIASDLTANDWILLESFPINTTAFSSTGGYESPISDWTYRGQIAVNLRGTYGINIAAVGIINNANVNGQVLFTFGCVSAMMWALEAFGTSDTSYASLSAAVTYWTRSDITGIGHYYEKYPGVTVDGTNANLFWRYTNAATLSVDFTTSAQTSAITKFSVVSNSGYSGYSGYSGVSGYSGTSGKSGYSGYSGVSGYSGYSGVSGYSGYSGKSGYSGYSGYSGKSGYSGYSGPAASDIRIKKDIRPFTGGIDIIKKLNPIIYKFNGMWVYNDDDIEQVGIIGQELESIIPQAVKKTRGKLYESGEETDIIEVNVTPIIFALVNAVKELSAKIEKLETKLKRR